VFCLFKNKAFIFFISCQSYLCYLYYECFFVFVHNYNMCCPKGLLRSPNFAFLTSNFLLVFCLLWMFFPCVGMELY
jgi:hypothetical protein